MGYSFTTGSSGGDALRTLGKNKSGRRIERTAMPNPTETQGRKSQNPLV